MYACAYVYLCVYVRVDSVCVCMCEYIYPGV